MYQVIIKTFVGKRIEESVYTKIYKYRKVAENKAKEFHREGTTINGEYYHTKAYVRGLLKPITEEEAKTAYCKGYNVWYDVEYGKERMQHSWEYCSHAPAEELFYRSRPYYYEGNYYIEEGDR